MSIGWREALAGAALVFIAFLAMKMRPRSVKRGALTSDVQAARQRARDAKTPEERATALTEAGRLAGAEARWTAAAGFFLRAMKSDPGSAGVLDQMIESLGPRRPKLLEKILWRRLAHSPWDAEHAAATRAAAKGLASLYEGKRRDAVRAEFFKRFLKSLSGNQFETRVETAESDARRVPEE